MHVNLQNHIFTFNTATKQCIPFILLPSQWIPFLLLPLALCSMNYVFLTCFGSLLNISFHRQAIHGPEVIGSFINIISLFRTKLLRCVTCYHIRTKIVLAWHGCLRKLGYIRWKKDRYLQSKTRGITII